jgi:Uma2 family endonuclease
MSIILFDEMKTASPPRFATEDEFEAWCDEDTKAEYVDGEVIVMTPASIEHDSGETTLGNLIDLFVKKNKLGWVSSTGNFQVRLRSGLRRCPDIIFVEKSRIDIIQKTYIDGAPDLVVEFVSPDSVIRDWHEKYIEYEAAGIREYWIIDQDQQRAVVYSLGDDRRYQPITLKDGRLYSRVLSGFWVKVEWFWQDSWFDTYKMAKEIGIIA